jgi:hypothetical protein
LSGMGIQVPVRSSSQEHFSVFRRSERVGNLGQYSPASIDCV